MRSSRWHFIPAVAALFVIAPGALAQPSPPRIGYVYPAGGRQGTEFHAAVGGQHLAGVTNASVSGPGIQAVVIDLNRPMPQQQFNRLRDQFTELRKKRATALQSGNEGEREDSASAWTGADEKRLAEIREQILTNPPNRNATPAIAETATIRIAIAPDAEPGEREIRLRTPHGLSNPLVFHVGQLPEFTQPPAQAANPALDRFRERLAGQTRRVNPAQPEGPMRITLPAVINGQIMPGGVDRFRFAARKGQQLVVAVSARALIPYLADAVPGWFQATLVLYDAQGSELAYAGRYQFQPDPVLFHEIPATGEYVLEIRDSIYRGREDFVYRISVGALPFVTSLFPLGGRAGAATAIELSGPNLPTRTLVRDNQETGIHSVPARGQISHSNRLPFAVDDLPESLEQEPNDSPSGAQSLTFPIIVNGRIDHPGDWDVFRIEGRAGDELVAEVFARRLNSPLDSLLKVTDAAGRQLAVNDDHEDRGAGLTTHHADSRISLTLPADGNYYLHLGDSQHQGGPEYAYRLRISRPQPDFELRIVPSSINVRGGASVPVTVYALRRDGFSGEVLLTLKDAPPGLVLSGGRVPADHDQVRITLTPPPNLSNKAVRLAVEGRALINGQEIIRPAVPAEDMIQAFIYRHLVPAQELKLAVSGRAPPRRRVRMMIDGTVKIPAGGTARVRIAAPGSLFANGLLVELCQPPDGIEIQDVSFVRDGAEIVFRSDAEKPAPGLDGNLIVNASLPRAASPGNVSANQRPIPLGSLPAIPFEIIAPGKP